MGQSRVVEGFTLVCPVALQLHEGRPVCKHEGARTSEQLGRHIRKYSQHGSCLPGSKREASVIAHRRLYNDCVRKGYMSSKDSPTMLRAGVSAMRLLCSSSQLQQYRTGRITADKLHRLTGEDRTVW